MDTSFTISSNSVSLFIFLILCLFSLCVFSCPPLPPVAILDISPESAETGESVLLDGRNSYAPRYSIRKYEWDFTNDGSYDYYETLTHHPDGAFDGKTTHIYNNADTYTARLRVAVANLYDTDTDTVTIEPATRVVYTYDEVGNKMSMTDSTGITTYTYDYLNRLTSVTNPDGKTVSYQYDPAGNRTQLTDPEGNVTTYAYNGNNQLTDVNSPQGVTTYQYDSLGNLTRTDYPNGAYTEYSYGLNRGWLIRLANKEPNSLLSSYSYTYDNVGNRLSVIEQDGSVVTYTYDDIYQLTSEVRTGMNAYTITYQYDAVGNRVQMVRNSAVTNYTYNSNNQLLTEIAPDANIMYYYDDNGNLFSKTEAGDANNTVVYSWDQRDLLLSVFEPAGDTYYEYDGNGNRISKTRNGVTTRYINDQARSLVQVLAETDVNGVTQKSYTYGNDLISMKTAYSKSYYHYDGLGSVRNLTNSTCAVTADYTYDGFGNLITSTGVSENNYGFTGEQQFAEADGLVFLRARYYDTETGRFIKRDPLGVDPAGGEYNPFDPVRQYADGVNIYVYVQNNPVINIDPYGLKCHYKQRCRKIGRIYICPPQNSPVNCQDCCDHLINDFAKPSWLNPCKRLKWFLSRKNLITACYIGCQGQVPIIVF